MASLYDNSSRDFTINEGCPWYEAQQSFGAPNVNWCEPTICSYINEPANTWTNLAYIFVGLFFALAIKQINEKALRNFGWIVFAMGWFSFIYHATNNYLTQFFDFFGMYLMTSFVVAFNWQRVREKNPRELYAVFWFMTAVNVSLFMIFDIIDIAVQHTVAINVVPMFLLDLWAGHKEGILKRYHYLFGAILVLGVAQLVAQLDLKRVWCEPENILMHGHAIWHVLGGLGMLLIGFHFSRVLSQSKYTQDHNE